jgi:hypothetical protein
MPLKLQKFVPIDREYPIYEVTDESHNVLFDVSRTDGGAFEIGFHKDGVGRVLELEETLALILQARTLLEEER